MHALQKHFWGELDTITAMNSPLSKLDVAFLHNNEVLSDCDLKLITDDGVSRRLRKEDSTAEMLSLLFV